MNTFGYIVGHDYGFAPNPFGAACSLACCKAQLREAVRKAASRDEAPNYVFGMGSGEGRLNMTGRCIWWMRVEQVTDFKSYFRDPLYASKKPYYGSATVDQFGDNIYEWNEKAKRYLQHRSFHSHKDGSCNTKNYSPDNKSDAVLLSGDFGYYGTNAPKLPANLAEEFTLKGLRSMKRNFSASGKLKLVNWLREQGAGYQGDPASWGKLKVT
jgi:hypothetical protein